MKHKDPYHLCIAYQEKLSDFCTLPPPAKKILENQSQDNGDENVDLETMLSSFVG